MAEEALIPRKRGHSWKPDELYGIVEACSPGPYIELFARHQRDGWEQWGDEVEATHQTAGQQLLPGGQEQSAGMEL
jgi:N6-adenosine-specific RNA methylase IME4